MRVIDCDWIKRNGKGQSVCHLCNKLTWDSFCYDFELKILDKELFYTVLCADCISKIGQELECKISSNKEIIEEDKDIKQINKSYPIFSFDTKSFEAMKDMLQDVYSKQCELIDVVNELRK